MGDRLERATRAAGGFAADAAQQVADAHQQMLASRDLVQQGFGFSDAAGITQRCIQKRLDAMDDRLKSGTLPPTEQPVYQALKELLDDIEKESDRYWLGSGIDWRPMKPIARTVRRPEGPGA